MTVNEFKTIKQSLKVLADFGAVSAASVEEIGTLVDSPAKSAPALPELMTRPQVAERIGTCPRTVRNYERSGLLRPIRLAGKRLVRYRREDVERFLEEGGGKINE